MVLIDNIEPIVVFALHSLGSNEIQYEGCTMIAEALKTNNSLTILQ
jgi:hypothetical protein